MKIFHNILKICYNLHVIEDENVINSEWNIKKQGEYLIMNISEEVSEQKQLLISKLSITSFFLAVSSYILLISVFLFDGFPKMLAVLVPLIVIFFMIISLILSIIDLKKKHRKKVLSVIALILSSLYFLLFIGAIILLAVLMK